MYIKVAEGVPVDHPILLNNFKAAYPSVNPNSPDSGFLPFKRTPRPLGGVYDVVESKYVVSDNIVKEVWTIRPMTAEEMKIKQKEAKSQWALTGYPSWVFDETSCTFNPPKSYPQDGNKYFWNEDTQTWDVIDA